MHVCRCEHVQEACICRRRHQTISMDFAGETDISGQSYSANQNASAILSTSASQQEAHWTNAIE